MARTLTEIFNQAKECRNQYLGLTEFENTSKMSIMDMITWVTSSCIWTFENIIEVFKVDLAKDLKNRINGTPAYFTNALLKYQRGDDLQISEDGSRFYYAHVDKNKCIISKASYHEATEENFHDKVMVFKIATGTPGKYEQIEKGELLAIKDYLSKILFAGQHALVVSRKGDILIPRINVYYDGSVSREEVYEGIEKQLNEFIANINFDGVVYAQKIVDSIQKTPHVVDVDVTHCGVGNPGIFIVQYDDDDHIIKVPDSAPIATETQDTGIVKVLEQKVDRFFYPNSGYLKQSSGTGEESEIPAWRDSINLIIEKNQ